MPKSDDASRIPPHNLDAERALLGAVLLEGPDAMPRAASIVRETDFFLDAHRVVWQSMVALFEEGVAIDLVILQEHLRRVENLSMAGGPAALALLVEQGAISAYVPEYAEIIRDLGMQREMIQIGTHMVTRGFQAEGKVQDLIGEAEARIFSLTERRLEHQALPVGGILEATMAAIEARYERGHAITGIPTGLTDLDDMTAGLQPSELILIAGRPSSGKTALGLSIGGHAALVHDKKVAVFSIEMTADQLVQRLLAAEGRIDGSSIRSGQLAAPDWARLAVAAGRLSQTKLFIDDSPSLTSLELRAKARRLANEHGGLDLIIIYYLNLMSGSGRARDNRQQEVTEISRGLKGLARELKIPVVALSQLSRAIEIRGDNTPRLSDLRESGSLEQDADVILFVHRPSLYDAEADLQSRNTAEVHIGKQRNGPTGKLDVAYLARYTRFDNLSALRDHEPTP